jgi:hypothetical protein
MNTRHILTPVRLGALALCFTASVAHAWHVSGKVWCDADGDQKFSTGDVPVENISVLVANASGSLSITASTKPDGTFFIELPHTADSYSAYIKPASLPDGTSVILPAGGIHTFALKEGADVDRFEQANFLIKCPPQPSPAPGTTGTRTPGYWKNHAEAWPVQSITIGGVTYSKEEALDLLNAKEGNDRTLTMFSHLIATKLNLLAGASATCIQDTVDAADAWLTEFEPESGVHPSSAAWKTAEKWKDMLDSYNNGKLCAPKAD